VFINYVPRITIVVRRQITHVFQKKELRVVMSNYPTDMKEQIAAIIIEPFLESRLTKRLARKASTQYIERRHDCLVNLRYIAGRFQTVILFVYFSTVLVNVACEYALGANVAECLMKSADPTEQIDEF
jgi:hypothetical protein